MASPSVRFYDCYKVEPSGCWNWTRSILKNRGGYGRYHYKGSTYRAHRYSWKIHRGDPGAKFVCHKCDNPKCVNPAHLFLGSPKDNTRDMIKKGRKASQKGEMHSQNKLTNKQVNEIRERLRNGELQRRLAIEYGVSPATISSIYKNKRWKI